MHRTTISLEGSVEQELRRLAAKEKRSFTELVNELLKKGLNIYKNLRRPPQELQWNTTQAKPNEGFDPADRSTYLDIISRKLP